MRKLTFVYCISVALLFCAPLPAHETGSRPLIGLALSGGGTKAGAHIGVLRVLEQNRVPIDFIAGTSAGAIIGSLCASGLSPDQIEAAIAAIDWDDMLQDAPPRRDLPYRRLNRNVWMPVYAGISLEAGNVWDTHEQISFDRLRYAGAAYAGADTPPGPLYIAWGLAERGENTIYLYLGNPFVAAGSRPLD